jgi:hypothetical protein
VGENTFYIGRGVQLLLVFLIFSSKNYAQEEGQFQTKYFLIIGSVKTVDEARLLARQAEQKTGFTFKDPGLLADSSTGATFPRSVCESDCGFEFPCYVARGRYDDGNYLSIEYSNAYEGFAKGFFIVVAASSAKDLSKDTQLMNKIRAQYPKCYVKKNRVYIGCMH